MTLTQMLAAIRYKIDETSASFWTDAELTQYVNDGYLHYWQWMIRANHPSATKYDYFDIVSGTAEIALPSDFVEARLVEIVLDGVTIPLEYSPRFERANSTNGVPFSSVDSVIFDYDFEGQNLILQPTPSQSLTDGIKITYFYAPTQLSSGSDEPVRPFNTMFSDLLVGWAVIQAKEKEEMVGGAGADLPSFVLSQKQREQQFKETIELSSKQRYFVAPYGLGY